ncbi:MAG: DUF1175 domain-containing protein [Myxococcaceae bacterium]|nr:DUF1175 domain-containing protein [Myxococcaceae bacterium]
MLPLLTLALAAAPTPPVELLRQAMAEVAIAQVKRIDEKWQPEQRDCAGLVRFSLRQAYRRVDPSRLERPLFTARTGPTDFADAETLLGFSFVGLTKDVSAATVRTGDVLAFRQPRESGDVFHLMLVVAPADRAHGEVHVVYHPGEKDAPVRAGRLSELTRDAPGEWRPVPQNPSFLGVFRFKEWPS